MRVLQETKNEDLAKLETLPPESEFRVEAYGRYDYRGTSTLEIQGALYASNEFAEGQIAANPTMIKRPLLLRTYGWSGPKQKTKQCALAKEPAMHPRRATEQGTRQHLRLRGSGPHYFLGAVEPPVCRPYATRTTRSRPLSAARCHIQEIHALRGYPQWQSKCYREFEALQNMAR